MKPIVPTKSLKGIFARLAKQWHRLPSSPVRVTARGTSHTLPGMKYVTLRYTKKDRALYERDRQAFSRLDFSAPPPNRMVGARRDWLRQVSDPAVLPDATLRKAGWTGEQIAAFRAHQFVPSTHQVHHRIPLDDGGTNEPSNFVLLRQDPEHGGLTNAQLDASRNLAPGETVDVNLPMPPVDAIIWPN